MCGRARATLGRDQVAAAARTDAWVNADEYSPRYNAQPGAVLPVVRAAAPDERTGVDGGGGRVVESMRWGLVPSFTSPTGKADFFRMFNARSETLAEKGVFSRLLEKRRRGVVLLNGFYEWAAEGGRGRDAVKQPYYLHITAAPAPSKKNDDDDAQAKARAAPPTKANADETEAKTGAAAGARGAAAAAAAPRKQGQEQEREQEEQVLRCAALYDVWHRSDGPPLVSCTIITVPAARSIAWLHDRMPAVLRSDEDVSAWLQDGETGPETDVEGGNGGGGGGGDVDESGKSKSDGEGCGADDARDPGGARASPSRLLRPYEAGDLRWHPVTTAMSKPDFEGPECCERVKRKVEQNVGSVAALFSRKTSEKRSEKTSEKTSEKDGSGTTAPEAGTTGAEAARAGAGGELVETSPSSGVAVDGGGFQSARKRPFDALLASSPRPRPRPPHSPPSSKRANAGRSPGAGEKQSAKQGGGGGGGGDGGGDRSQRSLLNFFKK